MQLLSSHYQLAYRVEKNADVLTILYIYIKHCHGQQINNERQDRLYVASSAYEDLSGEQRMVM